MSDIPTVGIYIQGGSVCGIRASTKVRILVVDYDNLDALEDDPCRYEDAFAKQANEERNHIKDCEKEVNALPLELPWSSW